MVSLSRLILMFYVFFIVAKQRCPPGGRMRIDGPGPGEGVLGRIRGDLVGYPGSVIYDP